MLERFSNARRIGAVGARDTQHDDGHAVFAQQFARVIHESPGVAFANVKGKTGPLPLMRSNAPTIVNVQPESTTSSTRITGAARISRSIKNASTRLRTCCALFSI